MKRAQHAAHNPKFPKDGIIQTSPVVAKNRLKDPPTWLKVATTLEKPPTTPTVEIRWSYDHLTLHNGISYTSKTVTFYIESGPRYTGTAYPLPSSHDSPPATTQETLQSKYNAEPLSRGQCCPNPHKRHPIARPLWGVFCWLKLWWIFCLSHWSDVCNIMLYWTVL